MLSWSSRAQNKIICWGAVRTKVTGSLMGYWAISDRVIVVKLSGKSFNINIVQVYAPTSNSDDNELETFYEDVNKALRQCKSQEIVVVMGDLTAKVGQGTYSDVVGPHGLGKRNERGNTWVQWCEANGQVICNTFFKHHPRRLWTWKSPDDRTKNQIDYITISKRFRKSITQVKGYPGADCKSDHVLLVATFHLKLKKVRFVRPPPKWCTNLLRDKEVKEQYQETVFDKFSAMEMDDRTRGAKDDYCIISQVMISLLKKCYMYQNAKGTETRLDDSRNFGING